MFKRGNWVVLQKRVSVDGGFQIEDAGIGLIARVTADGKYVFHWVEPNGETRMKFDEIRERDVTDAIVVGADELRIAMADEIPVSRR